MAKKGRKKVEHLSPIWSTRITWNESVEMLKLGKLLFELGKISVLNRYAITKFALRSLMQTLKRLHEKEAKEQKIRESG